MAVAFAYSRGNDDQALRWAVPPFRVLGDRVGSARQTRRFRDLRQSRTKSCPPGRPHASPGRTDQFERDPQASVRGRATTGRDPKTSEAPAILAAMETFLVDCESCTVRGVGCSDCVVSVLLGVPDGLELDHEERTALAVLSEGGLLPPLRSRDGRPTVGAGGAGEGLNERQLNFG